MLHTLEGFGVPFICLANDARITCTSAAADRLLAGIADVSAAVTQIARAASTILASGRRGPPIGPFELVGELPGLEVGRIRIHRPQREMPGVAALVVLEPVAVATVENPSTLGVLTARELAVAKRIALGLSNKEIASELAISAHTVRHHGERIFEKLGVRTRAGVARVCATSPTGPAVQ